MKHTLPDNSESVALDNIRGELKNVKLIGKGGMSHVFRAWQPSLERFIVVKRLKDDLIQNPETAERFRREARALASVLHQNIAHVYDYVEKPGEAFILMEYIEGMDLSAIIEKAGGLPPAIAACILLEVSKGLAYIHERGLIHRDVKPSNIRVTNRGEVKLMDFGIVLQVENTSLTRPGVMVGSPSYLSPEQILGDQVSNRADIFLMGIVLYEMLSGTRPFKEDKSASIFQRIRESRYVQLRQMEPSVPRALERIVDKCLRKEPARRYSKVESLIADLVEFIGPTMSANPQKYVIHFLEDQRLMQTAVSFEKFPTSSETSNRRWWSHWKSIAVVAALAISFGMGILSAHFLIENGMQNLIVIPGAPQFSKPKPISGHGK